MGADMIETLLVYAAWAALATAVVSSIVITQRAIKQLLQDSADGSADAREGSGPIDAPPMERHV
jgi:hypothetical protein